MSWWGKVVGGSLGFILGGPLGALLGVAIGHSLDDSTGGVDWAGIGGTARAQTAFFTATFSVMGHLAKVDGRVSEREIELARAVMAHMRLSPEQEQAAIRLFEQGKQTGFPMRQVLEQFRRETRGRADLARMFLEIQVQAALADGALHGAERQLLEGMCSILRIDQRDLDTIEALVRAQMGLGGSGGGAATSGRGSSLADAYRVLGVAEDASDAEVKRAYRRLMNQHHPDKLVARGLPEEMVSVAQERTAEIRQAWERIREARGLR